MAWWSTHTELVLYTFLKQLENQTHDFSGFISASPTLWYHDFYLNSISEKMRSGSEKDSRISVYLSAGALEDLVCPGGDRFLQSVDPASNAGFNVKRSIYNDMDHMDTGVITFTKGLQEFLEAK